MRTHTQQTKSSATRKRHVLGVASLFLAMFTILAAFVAIAQQRGAGQSTDRLPVAAVARVDRAGRGGDSRLQTNRQNPRSGTPDNSLSFLPPVAYD
jgi:hypothetical protein